VFGPAYFGPRYFGGAFYGPAGAEPAAPGGSTTVFVPGTILTDGLGFYVEVGPGEPGLAQDLLDAIWAYADADAALYDAFGRPGWLWVGKGARGIPLPYAVVFETGSDPVGMTTGATYHENVGIQFNVVASTEVEAKTLGELVQDTFAPREGQTALVFEGGTDLARWIGTRNILERDPGKGAGAVEVYIQRINLVWRVGRTLQPVG
jgi:hypothetical protein